MPRAGTRCSPASRAPRPSCAIEYLRALHASASAVAETGWAPHFLLLEDGGELRRRLPALPQGPLVRRVRVRLGLGRRLPAPRPRLLPQAHRRDPVHAGAGAAPAGATHEQRAAAAARHRGAGAPGRHLVGAPAVPRRRRPGRGDRGRLVAAPARCSSTGSNRAPAPYADFADFLASLQREKRKKIQQERRRVADAGVSFTRRDGARDRRRRLGLLLPLLHPHLPRAPLDALPEARLLRRAWRRRCPRTGCSSPPGAAASGSPAR